MTRSFFLVSVSTVVWSAATPRIARAAPIARVQVVRRSRMRLAGIAGSCASRRRRGRWSGFTAADFA
jgi:hypothetical protein